MIRRAQTNDAACLTKLSFDSKRYWNYPEEYYAVWSKELTITPEYIDQHEVYVYKIENRIIGYYSLVELVHDIEISGIILKKGYWLEHMFIAPDKIGQGFGKQLFAHLKLRCRQLSITIISTLADPHARGFYEKMGCSYVGEYPSTIKGRTTPHLVFEF